MSPMAHPVKPKSAILLLAVVLIAGCSGKSGDKIPDELAEGAPEVDATETTGGIRGIVVDEAIRPIEGVTIDVVGGGAPQLAETDAAGLFAVSGLQPGTYILKAHHPFYDSQQASADVEAGVKEPAPVKILLTRQIFEQPYLQTIKYDGFIVCSANAVALLSEECGEGVGVDCIQPPVPCGRIGGQNGNNVQFDFTIANENIKSMIVEKVWKPTSEASEYLTSPIATEWNCNPSCGGNRFAGMDGPSPLYVAIDEETLKEQELVPQETIISIFTWTSIETNPVGIALNQAYADYVSMSYFLPAPEGWSFVNGDPDPFK